jgi:tRNA pseudouridine38-40 synthase
MRNIKLILEYDGTNYAGWQRQKNRSKTIQQTVEGVLHKILQERVHIIASGRTDSGVHALGQVANFKTHSIILLAKLQLALNALLPDDIVITKAEEVGLNFHAIRDVESKVYRYTILNRNYDSALLKNKVYFCHFPLDENLMRRESRCLVGRHDFRAFCASGSRVKSTVRVIKRLTIKKIPYDLITITRQLQYKSKNQQGLPLIIIEIEADGFLYNMVRSIVGTLIDIGRSRLPKNSLKEILLSKDRKFAGRTVPASGLCLFKVNY